jgi:hypothetical protein
MYVPKPETAILWGPLLFQRLLFSVLPTDIGDNIRPTATTDARIFPFDFMLWTLPRYIMKIGAIRAALLIHVQRADLSIGRDKKK